jgi:A/G-specific adenine glycosylase
VAKATEQRTPRDSHASAVRAKDIASALIRWFAHAQRDLPWRAPARTTRRDPYHVLVSETMLQQTQVSRVVEKFEPFLELFPTLRNLANASEDEVLAAWTGLGYYRRARMLHAAAKAIASQHAGTIPHDVPALLALPGIGKYTAGAIASIAFNEPQPIVDTNVSRVLLRVFGKELAAKDAEEFVWEHAAHIARAGHASQQAGTVNEAMMELGALVCTPTSPSCSSCPLSAMCIAHKQGTTERIPPPKAKKSRTPVLHVVFIVRDASLRVAIERRSSSGLWGGLFQLPTVELPAQTSAPRAMADALTLAKSTRPELALAPSRSKQGPLLDFVFHTTHREVRHVVFAASSHAQPINVQWVTPEEALDRGMASPQRRIVRDLLLKQNP